MGKHAYLIMAHSNMEQLLIMIKCLDYYLNDIYVHVDAKFECNISELQERLNN